jgi:hypothetical protein
MELVISSDGTAKCVYSEEIDLSSLGTLTIRRGSHVEPTGAGQWLCDLSPVNGPTLGPFVNRSEALSAEQAWLNKHWLTPQ